MSGEAVRYHRHHRRRRLVGDKVHWFWIIDSALRACAIVLVQVPAISLGLAVKGHQQPGLAPHVAIEIFHR